MQVGLGLIERVNGELLRRSAATKASDLRKDKPDPMTGLSPGSELSEDCVIHALLRVEKAVEIVSVGHGRC